MRRAGFEPRQTDATADGVGPKPPQGCQRARRSTAKRIAHRRDLAGRCGRRPADTHRCANATPTSWSSHWLPLRAVSNLPRSNSGLSCWHLAPELDTLYQHFMAKLLRQDAWRVGTLGLYAALLGDPVESTVGSSRSLAISCAGDYWTTEPDRRCQPPMSHCGWTATSSIGC